MASIDRLSALDCAFLDLETAHAPLHIGWTLRFEGAAPSLAALRRHLDAKLDAVPRFRRTVAELPGGAAWVDDAAFDIANHVHHVTLPKPGGTGELRDTAGALLSRPLDRERPLWRMYLVDGFADGGFALVGQVHHALVDGIAAIEVALLLFDGDTREPPPSTWRAQPAPAAATAVRAAAADRAAVAFEALRAVARNAHPAAVRSAAAALSDVASPAPSTALDRSLTSDRVVAFGSAPLDAVKEAGSRRGATVNDVLLAATTLALGRALARRDERPRALKALVPVNVRDGDAAKLGNAVSFAAVELPLGETDPTALLRAVRDRTRTAKRDGAARPLEALARAGDLLPGPGRRAIARTAARAASFNAVISNVPGPPQPLSLMGRALRSVHPAVPLLDGHGLTICGLSYAGRLHVGVYADAQVLPDAVEVARDIESAFDAFRLDKATPQTTPWRARARERRQRAAKR
jgi:WS/DGAT/MGAT family acyltransferase